MAARSPTGTSTSATATTVKRRRKRNKPSSEAELECIFDTFNDDDSTPNPLPPKYSLNRLLYHRQLCGNQPTRSSIIAGTMRKQSCLWYNGKPRSYCKRTIRFGQLSHTNHVILGWNDGGDVLMALSEDDDAYAVTLYGLPSRLSESNGITDTNNNGKLSMVRLSTIPLPLRASNSHQQNASFLQQHHPLCAPARIPTRILNLGLLWVVLYRPDFDNHTPTTGATTTTAASATTNALLHVVLQSTGPNTPSRFYLTNVHSPEHCAVNHVLLAVDCVPTFATTSHGDTTGTFQRTPAYLLVLDEEDGLRLSYFRHCDIQIPPEETVEPLWTNVHDQKKVFRKRLRRIIENDSQESGWEGCGSTPGDYDMVGTMYLSVVCLLFDILSHLPHLVRPRFDRSNLPYFCYHVVQLHEDRILELLIVANVATGQGCFGVFCQVDLYTHDYRIVQCIRTKAYDTPTTRSTLKLAQQRRTRQVWPPCTVTDNANVLLGRPVASLKARSAPVELTYEF